MTWNDSPPPSWYEPADDFEDDEPEILADDEPLTISAGIVSWRSIS
jgi:hypothetical protein